MSWQGPWFWIDLGHPGRLWLLVGLLPLVLWSIRGGRRRLRDWAALGQSGKPTRDGATFWLAAMGLLILALAQPRWGRVAGSEQPEGHDVVLCVDVSRSMAAEDAVPDRLRVAIESGLGLLRALDAEPGHRASVIAFAGRAAVRCPLTSDLDAAAESLRALRPGEVQPGGTDLGTALEAAAGTFDEEDHAEGRTIVILSDGEDHPGSWPRALARLADSGIIVHAVAVGDPDQGHPVPANPASPARANAPPPPETRRTDEHLRAIARETGGAFVPIGLVPVDLGKLYRERIAPMARRKRDEIRPPERVERFPIFLLAALGIGLAGSWPVRARKRWDRLPLIAVSIAAMSLGAGPGSSTPGGLIESGRTAFKNGKFEEALGSFVRAIDLRPGAAIPRYDAAAALFQLRRYREAIVRYEEARERGDGGLATKIDYALGNAYLALGEVPEALAHYDACIDSKWPGLPFDAVRRDAAENRAFAVAQSPPPPEDAGGESRDESKRGRPSPPQGGGPDSPDDPDTSPGPNPPAQQSGGTSTPSKTGSQPGEEGEDRPSSRSPEDRLDDALRDIRDARDRGPTEDTPRSSDRPTKDW
ncbi:VWA domain-containing protein [Tundrisphaera lichenicola]|uniref:vWA domain-containing protein n=1 Tax=Tundrisphaera lichenicola TaxID=2029860 RepID=UPI003EBA5857